MPFTTEQVVYADLATTTFANKRDRIMDQISQAATIFHWLLYKGRRVEYSGGRHIEIPLLVAFDEAGGSTSGYDPLNVSPSEGLTVAVYRLRTNYQTILFSDEEMADNMDRHAALNLVNARLNRARISMSDRIARQLNGDGSGNQGKDIEGLGYHFRVNVSGDGSAATATGAGRIDGAARAPVKAMRDPVTNADWRSLSHQYMNTDVLSGGVVAQKTLHGVTRNLNAPATLAGLWEAINRTYNALTYGSMSPDVLISDEETFSNYQRLVQPLKRFPGDARLADAGFKFVDFNGVPFMFDRYVNFNYSGSGITSTASNTGGIYFINSQSFHFGTQPNRFFYLTPFQKPLNGLHIGAQMVLRGNCIDGGPRYSGLLHCIPRTFTS